MQIGKSRHNYIRRNLRDIKNILNTHNQETTPLEITYYISYAIWNPVLIAVAQESINNSENELIPIA